MKKIFQYMDFFEETIASAALWGFTLVSFLQVVCRYGFNHALAWPEEISRYCLICMAFFGIAMVMKTNGHLRVEVLTAFVSRKTAMALNLFSAVVIGLFCCYTIFYGIQITWMIYQLEQTAMSMDFNVWITWLPIPLGFFLMFVQLVRYEIGAWRAFRNVDNP